MPGTQKTMFPLRWCFMAGHEAISNRPTDRNKKHVRAARKKSGG